MLFTGVHFIKFLDKLDEEHLQRVTQTLLDQLINLRLIDSYENSTHQLGTYNSVVEGNVPCISDIFSTKDFQKILQQVATDSRFRWFSYTPIIKSQNFNHGNIHCNFLFRDMPHLNVVLLSPYFIEPPSSEKNIIWLNEISSMIMSPKKNEFDIVVDGNSYFGTQFSVYYWYKVRKSINRKWISSSELPTIFNNFSALRYSLQKQLESERFTKIEIIDSQILFKRFIKETNKFVLNHKNKKQIISRLKDVKISPTKWFGYRDLYFT